jgi:hypothetical protein
MIPKTQAKAPLIILTTLTGAAFCIILATLVTCYLKNYIGLLTTNNTTFVCSVYLSWKLESNRVSLLNLSFFGGTLSAILCVLLLI